MSGNVGQRSVASDSKQRFGRLILAGKFETVDGSRMLSAPDWRPEFVDGGHV